MRKKIKFICFLFMVMFVFPNVVLGQDNCREGTSYDECIESVGGNNVSHKVIYSVESFNISGNNLSFDGYAFIEHQHNIGSINGGRGNFDTYVVAYVGKWDKTYKENEVTGKSVRLRVTQSDRNMSESRCFGSRADSDGNGTTEAQENCKKAYDGVRESEWKNSCTNGASGAWCTYKNVGFSASITLDELINELGSEEEIHFRIVLHDKAGFYSDRHSDEYGGTYFSTELGVYTKNCWVNEKSCGTENEVGNFLLTIGGMSDSVTIAPETIAYRNTSREKISAGTCKDGNSRTYKVFNSSGSYIVSSRGSLGSYQNSYDTGRSWKDVLYALKASEVTDDCFVKSNRYGSSVFYAFGSWLSVTGSLTIELKENIVQRECDYYDQLTGGETKSTVKENSVVCENNAGSSGSGSPVNGKYFQCIGGKNNKIDVSGEVKLQNRLNTCAGSDTIKVSTNVLLIQEAEFNFGELTGFDNSTGIYAGKGFGLEGTFYNNTVTWVNALQTKSGIPYYKYETTVYSNGSCSTQTVYLDDNTKAKYTKSDGSSSGFIGISEAAFEVIDLEVQKKIKDGVEDGDPISNIKYKSCNGNDISSCDVNNPGYEVDGSWKKDETSPERDIIRDGSNNVGKYTTNKYSYSLADSYIYITGNEAGKAEYIKKAEDATQDLKEKSVATGQRFYVDFKWVYDEDFPFNLAENINPSLLVEYSEFDWKLNGTCDVNVNDSYYKDEDGDGDGDKIALTYNYRSIDVEKPFKNTSSIPVNWQVWWADGNNQTRLKSTYDAYYSGQPLYEVTIAKGGSSGDKLGINELNDYSNDSSYASMQTITKTGSNEFITSKFSGYFKTKLGIDNSYCPVGTFSTACDATK